jgi:flagellar basal-body rod modification protein FlgD
MPIETQTIASASTVTQQPASGQGSSKLGKNEFLKILTAQLANQDPTAPMDSNAFVAQLAQFSALEQMQNSNETLTEMLALQKSSSERSIVSMVGKDAVYDSNQMDLEKGGSISVDAKLGSSASSLTMVITGSEGQQVWSKTFGSKDPGTYTLTWDGCSDSGAPQDPGTYTVSVFAKDASGNDVAVTQQARGRITGVSFQNGIPELMIGNTPLSLSDVTAIEEPKSSY